MRAVFQKAAKDIFDAFGDVVLSGDYVVLDTTYVPGGDVQIDETVYALRFVEETQDLGWLAAAKDADGESKQLMFVTQELPVEANTKDIVIFGGVKHSILSVQGDPADAVTTITVRVR